MTDQRGLPGTRRCLGAARPRLRAARRAAALAARAAGGWLLAGALLATGLPALAQNAPTLRADALARARTDTENGIRLEHGEGVGRDFAAAQTAYCSAARAGYGDALVRLGWMYANGRGTARDDAVAATLFRRAAGFGHEMGARLADMIRGDADSLPVCMRPGGLVARTDSPGATAASGLAAAASGAASIGPPAQFRRPPASAERQRIVAAVLQMAPRFRLDPRLVMAVMQTESSFDAQARSPKNAQGLMQLIPETAERFAVRDTFDPVENLRGGMAYLRWLLAYFRGDVSLALAAYNAGERTVDRYRGVPPYSETIAYVQRIRAHYPFDRHPYDARATAPSVAFAPTAGQADAR